MTDLMNLQGEHTKKTHAYERKNLVWVIAIIVFLSAIWFFVSFEAMAGIALIALATQAITISYQVAIAESARAIAMSHLYVGLKDRLDEQTEKLSLIEISVSNVERNPRIRDF